MKHRWLAAQVALVTLLVVPLYLAVLPSALRTVVPWSRGISITAFFVLVPLALVALLAYKWVAPAGSEDDPDVAFEEYDQA